MCYNCNICQHANIVLVDYTLHVAMTMQSVVIIFGSLESIKVANNNGINSD